MSLLQFLCFAFQTCKQTTDVGALQKGADFVKAFILGFDVDVSAHALSLISVCCHQLFQRLKT